MTDSLSSGVGNVRTASHNSRMAKAKKTSAAKGISEILHFEVSSSEVAYKRITQKLRDLILSKALGPGTRLPTLTQLARLWNTNYFTVQTALTPLVNEGLLVRKQRTGTFVADNVRQIKTVGIYFGSSFLRIKHAAFYQALYVAVCDHFERLGIAVHLYMDPRPTARQGTPLKPLLEAIERSEVSAVIGSMLTSEESAWLAQLPVPVSLLAAFGQSSIRLRLDDFLTSSLLRLKERKCRSVALISAQDLPNTESFLEFCRQHGLKSRPEWVLLREASLEEFEEFGFDCATKILSGPARPDGLIVFPDSIAIGVIMGVLQKGVSVPKDLKLVLHCNEEVYFHCPLPADWQVVSVVKIVEALWKHLRNQAAGKPPRSISAGITLRPASADSPPISRKQVSEVFQIANEEAKKS